MAVDDDCEDAGGSRANWDPDLICEVLGERADQVDPFDRVELAEVIRICRSSANLSAAGRRLFEVSHTHRSTKNDADRLRKYLQRFNLDWNAVA